VPFICRKADTFTEMFLALGKINKDGGFQYYYLHDYQGTLFSRPGVTAIWGRNNGAGRQKNYTFDNYNEMISKLSRILKKRIESGYRMFYSYPRESDLSTLVETLEKREVS